MKYYTFIATFTGEPRFTCLFAAGIDEASLISAVSALCDHQISPGRSDAFLLAIAIIYRKAQHLLEGRTGGKPVHFSSLEPLESAGVPGIPEYDTGGLRIWSLDAQG